MRNIRGGSTLGPGGGHTLTPNFCRFGLVNVGLRPKKSPKMVIFGINFQGVYPLKSFLQNFAWGREPQDRIRMPNFTVVALKMWPYGSGKILGVDRKT